MCKSDSIRAKTAIVQRMCCFPARQFRMIIFRAEMRQEQHLRGPVILLADELADGCMASPAAVGKALILRTKTSLYRLEN